MFLQGALAAARTYQVTGPVIEATDKVIVAQKGGERWEIARDESTKIQGEPKVGQKVTGQDRMTATTVETKTAAPEAKTKSQ